MKLLEFEEITEDEIIHVVDIIKRDCEFFLQQCDNSFLYRGMPETNVNFLGVGNRIVNREPKDTKKNIQKYFDLALQANGYEALRSNSIFCSGGRDDASTYGKLKIIFPIGIFSFCWSPIVHDFHIMNDIASLNISLYLADTPDKKVEIFDKMIKDKEYTDKNLAKAILSKNEIWINCEKYYYIQQDYKPIELLKKHLFNT